jgi:SRSO17 transposase
MAATGTTTSEAQQWAEGLSSLGQRIGGRFARAEPRRRALAYLQGLLSPLERKNGWQLAEAAGDATPYGVQHLLGRAQWEAEAVRNDLCAYVVEHLGDKQAVLIVDETGFVKKGKQSVGVQRQYSGTAGRIENCQIGVFLVYASTKGRTFLDRALYLPQAWTQDKPRCRQAGVPETVGFATKPMLAKQMIARALAAGVPARWVSGDSVYGNDGKLRDWLEAQHLAHVLGVSGNHYVWIDWQQRPVAVVAQQLPRQAWQRLSAGSGSKGPRWFEWAALRLPGAEGGWQRWLLLRRQVDKPTELAYYRVFAPVRTSLAAMVKVAGTRWAVEECFETAKGEVGLDQYEVRSWSGWYRHITLALLAHAYLTVVRAQTQAPQPRKKKTPRYPQPPHRTTAADRARGAASAVGIGVEAGCPSGCTAWLVPMATPTSSRSAALALSATDQSWINHLQL